MIHENTSNINVNRSLEEITIHTGDVKDFKTSMEEVMQIWWKEQKN